MGRLATRANELSLACSLCRLSGRFLPPWLCGWPLRSGQELLAGALAPSSTTRAVHVYSILLMADFSSFGLTIGKGVLNITAYTLVQFFVPANKT